MAKRQTGDYPEREGGWRFLWKEVTEPAPQL